MTSPGTVQGTRPWTWEQLAAASLRRQFPRLRGRGPAAVAELLRRVGPIQSQAARAPFLAVAARLPGARHTDIEAAHRAFDVVRSSTLRGTVHTCAREQHGALDAVTRATMAKLWRRELRLREVSVEQLWGGIEAFATGDWRTPEELRAHLGTWLAEHEGDGAAAASRSGPGRHLAHGHSGLLRAPMSGAGWDRQTLPGYRTAGEVLGRSGEPVTGPASARAVEGGAGGTGPGSPVPGLVELVRIHLRAFGPATRADLAWWSGAGLRQVDAALAALADELVTRPGPQGADYHDLLDAPRGRTSDPGLRLLPEFDGLLLGYHPSARERFVDPRHLPLLWSAANGGYAPVVLHHGRITGSWQLHGSGSRRVVDLQPFLGTPALAPDAVTEPVEALATALDVVVEDVRVRRPPG